MKFDMNDPQGGTEDFHYPDIRISGFGFFRIFSSYSYTIDPRLIKFGMNDPKGGAEGFHYPDRTPDFGFFGYFHPTATILTLNL